MRILIDYTQIPLQKVGVGIYAKNLLEQLNKLEGLFRIEKIYVIVQNDDNSLTNVLSGKFQLIYVNAKVFRIFFLRFFLEQFIIPIYLYKYKINIIHSLHYSFPLISFRAKRVITIHDLTFFRFPKLHTFFKRIYFKFFIKLASKMGEGLICVSTSTKQDLVELTRCQKNLISVIPLGKAEVFHNRYSKNKINLSLQKYNISSPYILFIGTLEPRKNITNLISAFNNLLKKFSKYNLVIVGKKGWYFDEVFHMVEDFELKDKIIFTGFINEEDKPLILNGCDIFVYPSLYEGFGIPVLEAMACGKPVITSNISSIPEVAGNGAVLINPKKISEIQQGIERFLEDDTFRLSMSLKALKQAEKFSWENTAKFTLKFYEQVYKT